MKKNNILDILLLVFSFVFIVFVRYLYDNNVLNNWAALILTMVALIVLNYSSIKKYLIASKIKFKSARKNIWVLYKYWSYSNLL